MDAWPTVILVHQARVLKSCLEKWRCYGWLGPKLSTLKECATVVILKLFFCKIHNFCQLLANYVKMEMCEML